jgi:hypothetical protein
MSAQASKFIMKLASTVVLATLLAPRDLGLVATVTTVIGFLVVFRHAGVIGYQMAKRAQMAAPQLKGALITVWGRQCFPLANRGLRGLFDKRRCDR